MSEDKCLLHIFSVFEQRQFGISNFFFIVSISKILYYRGESGKCRMNRSVHYIGHCSCIVKVSVDLYTLFASGGECREI